MWNNLKNNVKQYQYYIVYKNILLKEYLLVLISDVYEYLFICSIETNMAVV